MNHICLVVSYDGTSYHGFQTQPQKNTIQDKLEEALFCVTGEHIKINGSGRTDAGVHARSQYIDFFVGANVPVHRWCMAMNSCLPEDIVVKRAYSVPDGFHSRRSAFAKTYKYSVNFNSSYDVFQKHMQYHFPRKIDISAMQQAAVHLIGEHDFTSFASSHNVRRSNIRTVSEIAIEKQLSNLDDPTTENIQFSITGSGFLQHMVRIIVGTLLDVGIGKKSAEEIKTILSARNRLLAGPTAPSHGLILWEVFYPEKFGLTLESSGKQ